MNKYSLKIRIVNLDTSKSYNPDHSKKLYNMYLELSESPPPEWQSLFTEKRKFPRHSMWREAWIEGKYIVVHCVPEEIEQYHLKDLREDVQNVSLKYNQLLEQQRRNLKDDERRKQEEREKLESIRKKLKFD